MSKTYEKCDAKLDKLIVNVMKQHHQLLDDASVTIDCVLVSAEDKDGGSIIALKRHGLPAAAKIQVTSLEDRARGLADAKLTIDTLPWSRMPEGQRIALIDHELQHLELQVDDNGNYADDLGRPKLKARPHDWELAGFAVVAERHGESAIEVVEVQRFQQQFGQLVLFPKAA